MRCFVNILCIVAILTTSACSSIPKCEQSGESVSEKAPSDDAKAVAKEPGPVAKVMKPIVMTPVKIVFVAGVVILSPIWITAYFIDPIKC